MTTASARLVIGTSGWGSRISMRNARMVATRCVEQGFSHFDTAPTYGSGYSQRVLARVGQEHPDIHIDTKYGQLNDLGLRGMAKKTVRADGVAAFLDALWQTPLRDRALPEFWADGQALHSFRRSARQLGPLKIHRFYLHAPPLAVANQSFEELRSAFSKQHVRLGISGPIAADIEAIAQGVVPLSLQLSLADLMRNYEPLMATRGLDIGIYGLFSGSNGKAHLEFENLSTILRQQPSWHVIVGVNKLDTASQLSDLSTALFD